MSRGSLERHCRLRQGACDRRCHVLGKEDQRVDVADLFARES